eukprot:SAG11_NODE_2147_length_3753_cov_2.218391_1_plen_77_part_00
MTKEMQALNFVKKQGKWVPKLGEDDTTAATDGLNMSSGQKLPKYIRAGMNEIKKQHTDCHIQDYYTSYNTQDAPDV